ncbi:MAG: hypothetical protein CMJ78_11125 [Planctomycetaceae bacterium]|nr:hypothetical protein [Planctomycetaceae bacterium]
MDGARPFVPYYFYVNFISSFPDSGLELPTFLGANFILSSLGNGDKDCGTTKFGKPIIVHLIRMRAES